MDPRRIAAASDLATCRKLIDGDRARDVVAVEFSFICAQIGIDISRLSDVIWNTANYVTLTTPTDQGSSIMPQKKNPDVDFARKVGRPLSAT